MSHRFLIALLALTLVACGRPDFGTTTSADENVVKSDADRETPGSGSPTSGDGAVVDQSPEAEEDYANNAPEPSDPTGERGAVSEVDFAFTAYDAVASDGGNAVLAPHGLARSLVVAHAATGTEPNAAIEMLLSPYLDYAPIYEGFNATDLELEEREQAGGFGTIGAVWAHESVAVEQDFADTLARYLGLQIRLVDFAGAPEDARATINNWYRDETNGQLSEVVAPGAVDSDTRLTVTDATWFNQRWSFTAFDPAETMTQTFAGLDSDVEVPMMYAHDTFFFLDGSDFDAVVLPFEGAFSLVAVKPDDLESFEQTLDSDFVNRLVDESVATPVTLGFPRIEVSDRVRLSSVADQMGLQSLFDESVTYSGFADETRLDDAHQRTRIRFDEEGVAAMSNGDDAADDGAQDEPPLEANVMELTFDAPFFFAIRDSQTGSLLFLGRVVQP